MLEARVDAVLNRYRVDRRPNFDHSFDIAVASEDGEEGKLVGDELSPRHFVEQPQNWPTLPCWSYTAIMAFVTGIVHRAVGS